ncbi:hypothetical protein RJ640_019443 [Escallonia rubra]|uniref:Reverse transcriptase domain-containing protein n=1 Tax=Escallonia rubra TaxID=112253 RepID=A0AA88QVQ8_9ASTE|nr:hypothetical protein RJ640_019443 [Escallonia rubra]
MNRLQTIEPKGPTIQDLQGEILSLKRDVKTLSTKISLLELHNIEEVKSEEEEEEIYLNDNNNRLKINPDIINDTKIPSPSKEQEILSIDRVVFQKWYVSIKTVISKDFTFEGIALIDSGADLNQSFQLFSKSALEKHKRKFRYVHIGLVQIGITSIVYIDDVLIYSQTIDQHWKHLNTFLKIIKHNGLAVSAKKICLFQTKIRFLGHNIEKGSIIPIDRSVEFASKFPDEIREKTQLQRFLGSLNYIADFYQDLYKDTKVLYQRLQKNPQPWTIVHTQAIRRIKLRAKTLPCLCLPLPEAFKIVETDASDIGYGGILKQKVDGNMTPPRVSSQKSGKGLLPRPNRYNLRKSIGSSSSQTNQEAMLGKFENSGYNAHAHCPDIIQIEDEEQDLSPIEVANNYLTNGWAYPQKASGKSRDYYEEILRLTKSVVLTHNFEKPPRYSSRNIELPFQFSKVEILKFITKKQWGIDPTRIRELPPHFSPCHFNYFDYIDAWNHVLLYQNPSHKHSWFIFFSRNFDGNFPNWIANWWLNYGPDFEEWPSTQVTEAYQLYAPMVKGLPKLQFMADFSISWILCWQYAIQKSTNSSLEYPPTLVRQFGSKWWPKFDDSHCNIEAVTKLFPTLKAASTKWKSYPKTKSHALHCEAEFSKRKNEILCRLSKEKPFLNKRELLQVVTFEMLKMSEEDYNADSDNSANSTKESSSGKEGSDEPITDNMSTGPTIDNMSTKSITSLTKEGLDTHVWAALRDDRHLSFDDSLLGMVETSLCNGPMYFNCYPNFSVSLSDPHIMDVLTLDIKTQRYNMRPQAQNLVLIYRIYYKAMSTICPAFKQIADPGKSVILFQSNPDKTNVMLPRRIKFNELTPPEDWIIENKGIRNNNSSVPETMYTVETPSEMPSSSGQNQNNYNPYVHDFDYNVLVIEDFQIDHKKLNDEFYAKHNRTNRAWYRISFSTEQRAQYKELFFQTLKAYKTYFPFFGWFYSYCLDNNIEIPEYMNPQKQINVFKRITREWYIWPTHEKQESIHPPFNKFAMKGDMNSNFLAAPLKHIVDTSTSNHLNSVTAGEIQSLAEQSNYTNIILSTIGEQTTRIEDTIFQVKDVVSDFYSKMQPPKGISDNIFGTSPSFNLASSSSSVC